MFPIFSQIISEYFLDRDDSNNTKGYAFFLGRHLLTIEGIVQGFQDQDQPLCWTLRKILLTWIHRQKRKENPLLKSSINSQLSFDVLQDLKILYVSERF